MSLLPRQVALAHLIDMINVWQAPHHVLSRQLAQRLDVDVAEALVPPPCLIDTPCRDAHRVCDLQLDGVEAVGRPPDSSQKPMALATNTHRLTFDVHVVTIFIKLTDTNEIIVKLRDQVHSVSLRCSPDL